MALAACAADAPPPSLKPTAEQTRPEREPEASPTLVEMPELPPLETQRVSQYRGQLVQGGLSFWETEPGSEVFLDGKPVPIDSDGHFILGFGRDHDVDAQLLVIFPDGGEERRTLPVGERKFQISRVDGLPPAKVTPYTDEQIKQIREEQALKAEARSRRTKTSYWRAGFDWPVRGRISSQYGAQRILNGEPRRPHSGTDVAAPPGTTPMEFQGTDVRAPSTGVVTLAREGMYFEGGLIFIDHGQELESAMLHLSRVDVEPGQTVTKGEVIGAVGMTGRATGPHLHWTVNWKGTPMDAELLVPPMTSSGN